MSTLNEVRNVVLILAQQWSCGYEQRGLLEVAHNEELLAQLVDDLGERPATAINVATIVFGL